MTSDAGTLLVGLASIAAFGIAFHLSSLVAKAKAAAGDATATFAVIGDRTRADEEKEVLVQRGVVRLFGHFGLLTLRSLVVFAIPGVILWVADASGVASLSAVTGLLLSWQVLVGGTVTFTAGVWLAKRR